jgi:S1-C subfamily serine protease
VVGVVKGSGAAKAGIKPGDVIVKLGDRDLTAIEDLYAGLREHKTGRACTRDDRPRREAQDAPGHTHLG